MSSSTNAPAFNAAATTTAEERKEAAAMRTGGQGESSSFSLTSHIPQVQIDLDSIQKYVIIAVYGSKQEEAAKYFVRGSRTASYHKDAARPLVNALRELNVPFEVIGGGRIDHNSGGKVKVFGFSYGFPWKNGQSKHNVTADLLQAEFPSAKVEFSDEGY